MSKTVSADQLVTYLRDTGTPPARVSLADAYLRDRPLATAAELYWSLDAAKVPLGTLRKAGKFVFGDTFEPEKARAANSPEARDTAAEVTRLRGEAARLQREIEQANREKLAYLNQRNLQFERGSTLLAKHHVLKAKYSREDLAVMGVE